MHEEGSNGLARVPHLTLSVESNHWAIRCAQAGLGTLEGSGLDSGALRSVPSNLRILADFETSFTSCGSN